MQINKEYFNYDKAIEYSRELAKSQGLYRRVLQRLLEFDNLQIQEFNNDMQENCIYDIVDFVMYLEG